MVLKDATDLYRTLCRLAKSALNVGFLTYHLKLLIAIFLCSLHPLGKCSVKMIKRTDAYSCCKVDLFNCTISKI